MSATPGNITARTTSHKVILPFYIYAAFAFLVSSILLFASGWVLFAITHLMALGWGTMIILGASHQLVPVFTEGKLYSEKLAYLSFILAAIGIPLLVYGFYVFDMGSPAKWGGRFVLLAILSYLINLGASISKGKRENVHAVFIFTATLWLFLTAFLGLALVYNFTATVLPKDSLHYLSLHAHVGIIGWFLLLVTGVGSRLIPMFLISKYSNTRLLWRVYYLINGALVFYILVFYFLHREAILFIPAAMLFTAISLFAYYCYHSFKQRLRKQVDEQMKISLLSVAMIFLPVVLLLVIITLLLFSSSEKVSLITGYGFMILFGWITSLILGMTFKTLPFIVWNKVYHHYSASGKTPGPKELFDHTVFRIMSISYLAGFILFASGILTEKILFLKTGSALLIITAILYNWNVIKLVTHKPHAYERDQQQ
jgi:hypothetical protein